jgi:hypothetical protein
MDAGTSTVTPENKPGETNPEKPEGGKDTPKGGSGDGRGKDGKPTPAPERKKPCEAQRGQALQAVQRHGESAAG